MSSADAASSRVVGRGVRGRGRGGAGKGGKGSKGKGKGGGASGKGGKGAVSSAAVHPAGIAASGGGLAVHGPAAALLPGLAITLLMTPDIVQVITRSTGVMPAGAGASLHHDFCVRADGLGAAMADSTGGPALIRFEEPVVALVPCPGGAKSAGKGSHVMPGSYGLDLNVDAVVSAFAGAPSRTQNLEVVLAAGGVSFVYG